jgi:hypothetical protein
VGTVSQIALRENDVESIFRWLFEAYSSFWYYLGKAWDITPWWALILAPIVLFFLFDLLSCVFDREGWEWFHTELGNMSAHYREQERQYHATKPKWVGGWFSTSADIAKEEKAIRDGRR